MRGLTPFVLLCFLSGCGTSSIGQQYLGQKYLNSPLGEGFGHDSDPLIRFDAFDCTTFVETSLANGDLDVLNHIRYADGVPSFLSRNHFIESDWLSNNSDLVENISRQYGETDVRHVTINKSAWLKNIHNIDSTFPVQAIDLEYLPYSAFESINNDSDIIVLFIVGNHKKFDTIGTDLAVVHMGFLLRGGKILRHASFVNGVVEDTDFDEYIAKRKRHKHNIGIVLLGIKK